MTPGFCPVIPATLRATSVLFRLETPFVMVTNNLASCPVCGSGPQLCPRRLRAACLTKKTTDCSVYRCAGFSGAQLANLVNEAALAAARGGAPQVRPFLR